MDASGTHDLQVTAPSIVDSPLHFTSLFLSHLIPRHTRIPVSSDLISW